MLNEKEVREVIDDLLCGNKELDDLNVEFYKRMGLPLTEDT